MKSIIELNLSITKVGFFAVWSVGILFQKKVNILMVEQENLKRSNAFSVDRESIEKAFN